MLEFKFNKTSLFPPPTGGSEPSPARARPPAGQGRREGEEHHAVLQQVLHTVILLPGRDGGKSDSGKTLYAKRERNAFYHRIERGIASALSPFEKYASGRQECRSV